MTFLLLLACASPPPPLVTTTDTGPSTTASADTCPGPYGGVYDEVWELFQADYPYFDYKVIDWHALRETCRPGACVAGESYASFLDDTLTCLLEPLGDHHV